MFAIEPQPSVLILHAQHEPTIAETHVPDHLPIGAHLTTPRRGYVHDGIYAGGGRVIHYAGYSRPFRAGPVEEVALERFADGQPLHVQVPPAPRFAGLDAVLRARSRLGEDRYSFWSNNCEHFIEWCIAGASRSRQIEASKARLQRALRWLAPLRAWGGGALVE